MIGYNEVARLAEADGIVLRTGCFCNVGACSSALNLSVDDVKRNYSLGRTCDDVSVDIIDGRLTGAIRISFGASSTIDDCDHFLKFLEEKFLNRCPKYWDMNAVSSLPIINNQVDNIIVLKDIYIYPIKSCGGMSVSRWPLTSSGLLYDRMWALVDANNTVITQKKYPSLSLLKISIDLEINLLTVSHNKPNNNNKNNFTSISIPINDDNYNSAENSNSTSVKVCGRRCDGFFSCVHSSQWFSDYLGIYLLIIYNILYYHYYSILIQVFNAHLSKLIILLISRGNKKTE